METRKIWNQNVDALEEITHNFKQEENKKHAKNLQKNIEAEQLIDSLFSEFENTVFSLKKNDKNA